MGVGLVVAGVYFFAVAVWCASMARRLEDTAKRAVFTKRAAIFGASASGLLGAGMLQLLIVGVNMTVWEDNIVLLAFGVGMIVAGVGLAWYMLRTGRHTYIERYTGATWLPTLLRVLVIASLAGSVMFVGMGLVMTTVIYSSPVLLIGLGVVVGASALIASGTIAVALFIGSRLETDRELRMRRRERGNT